MLRSKNYPTPRIESLQHLAFEELKSLDLRQCHSVADIVAAMRHCAFGARMLGEAAHTFHQMITSGAKPILIYDGLVNSPLGLLLRKFVENGWCTDLVLPADYAGM